MAVLYNSYSKEGNYFRLDLGASDYKGGYLDSMWVKCKMELYFTKEFPSIKHITDSSDEVEGVEDLIEQLTKLVAKEIDILEWEPMDPDLNITIKHSGIGKYEKNDNYQAWILIDTSPPLNEGYTGNGPMLYIDTNKECLVNFSEGLEKELKNVVKHYKGIEV